MSTSIALFCARVLVDELVRGGARVFCVAPGSRSTPLALAIAERSDLEIHVLTDERSMGFFALGLARERRRAVAVVCTSGTAAANLLPAAVEAGLGGGALLLLTADRPPELRACASPQTIDQVGLFGSHVRWAVDLPLLDASEQSARTLRSLASRAVVTARRGDGGPVHVNAPFREPFVDESFPLREPFGVAGRDGGRAFTEAPGRFVVGDDEALRLAATLGRARRGVIVCSGTEVPAADVALLAKTLGWPVVADPLSGLRFGDHDRSRVVDAIEPLLRDDTLRHTLRPDAVVRFGLTPPPRSLQRWLEEAWPAEHVVVADGAWPDPSRSASAIVHTDASAFCRALASAPRPWNPAVLEWTGRWTELSQATRTALDSGIDASQDLFDGAVLREVLAVLPDDATLVVGNSMPVRDAEAFLGAQPRRLRVLANRGASGIDGVLSTALGVASSAKTPTALVIGDLSFLHDAAALAFAARERIPLLIVVVNNDGGGIFSYLPLRDALPTSHGSEVFERFFGTPHGTDLEKVAGIAGGTFRRVTARHDLAPALADALRAAASGPAIVEVRTDREASRVAQQSIVRAAQENAARIVSTWRKSA